ncbi:hypothetical protein [Bacillus safensis]|uniref:hypothetical protein n=1 Tax=Bacillus safensis TaxID=561879 RepID=UPI002E1D8889|nr:hypothetical protein [Bacillus safensis]
MNMSHEEIKKWIADNLVDREEGRKITEQTPVAFTQATQKKVIIPFFHIGEGRTKKSLYLKSELEIYAKNKRKRIPMGNHNHKDIQNWMYDNLIGRETARQITGQSNNAFQQSLDTGKIQPFITVGTRKNSLYHWAVYLKSEIGEYAQAKGKKNGRRKVVTPVMGYDVTLYKIPEKLKDKHIDDDMLFDIAYGDNNEHYSLVETSFSTNSQKAVDFAELFDLFLTNDDYFKVYKMSDYYEAKSRMEKMSFDEEFSKRVKHFLNVIEQELNKGEIIFFCCG